MLIPPCSRCGAPSAFTDRATGEDLCPECLLRSIERRARRVVLPILGRGDRVAVALSGGKDSSLTLSLLKKFSEEIEFELVAITIDEGTPYR
ncbi:MAG: tRNA lysidine(34) synthetase TilS, partial [Thermoproteota archaeon]